MKKIMLIAVMAIFSSGVFAAENKVKSYFTKSVSISKSIDKTTNITKTSNNSVKAKFACTPSITKVPHYVVCEDFSWYSVDYVETTIVTCVKGVAVSNCYHWDQKSDLLCS